jgi:hypothetical protein
MRRAWGAGQAKKLSGFLLNFVMIKKQAMDIQTQKEDIIEQFKLLNDENLKQAIKNLLEYALKKEQESLEVPEAHQKIVMERFNKVRKDPYRLVDVPTLSN